jgi:hypothetical protein
MREGRANNAKYDVARGNRYELGRAGYFTGDCRRRRAPDLPIYIAGNSLFFPGNREIFQE